MRAERRALWNVANMQVLPVSKFNFQWDKIDGKLTIGSIGIGNIITLATFNNSIAPHAPKRRQKADNKKVRNGRCFAAHLLLISSSKVWNG